jgi:ribonucleotide reductase beta subunit family protein with ferritin-like domain
MNTYNTSKIKNKEPLLDEENDRMTIYPIKFPEIWKMYKQMEAAMWFVEEVDLSKDMKDWNKLNENEQTFIKNILAFFAASDTIVNINLLERFMKEIQPIEAKFAYGSQYAMESRHSEAYSLMIETYVKDVQEKNKLFNAIKTIPCVKEKADWAFKWIDSDAPFNQRLFAFCIVEGVFFSGAFASIFWLKEKNLMQGLCKFNKFISRDEGMHVDFAILLYSMLNKKMTQKTAHQIMKEAVEIEKKFITESIPCKLLGMNSEMMSEYIEFIANNLLDQLGYKKIYKIKKNPLDFMEKISMQTKENMFEGRVDEYQMAHISDKSTGFSISTDF